MCADQSFCLYILWICSCCCLSDQHQFLLKVMLNSLHVRRFFFQPSCVPGVLGRLLNKSLHYTPPSFWSILRNCCVHMWKSGAVTVTCEQQLSPGIFKLNKKLVLLSCRLDVAVCSSLSSAPRLPAVCPLFPSQPCSVYIADMPHEAREANVPEECQHEV